MEEEEGGKEEKQMWMDWREGGREEDDSYWGEITQSSEEGGEEMRGETFPPAHIKDIKKKTNRKTCLT